MRKCHAIEARAPIDRLNRVMWGVQRISAVRGLSALALAFALGCASPPEFPAQNPSTRGIEVEVFRLTNAYRQSRSLPPLHEASSLALLARGHSSDLARRGPKHVDHLGLRNRFERASESISLVSFSENVARMGRKRPQPATWVVDSWVASESHRKNIEGNYDLVGIGVFRREDGYYFFTQIFGGTAGPTPPRRGPAAIADKRRRQKP
jgi:uncharacterized protein YkwD